MKSDERHIKSYEKHIRSYEKHIKSYENHREWLKLEVPELAKIGMLGFQNKDFRFGFKCGPREGPVV